MNDKMDIVVCQYTPSDHTLYIETEQAMETHRIVHTQTGTKFCKVYYDDDADHYKNLYNDLLKEHLDMVKTIKERAYTWIPCSERLPKAEETVLVTVLRRYDDGTEKRIVTRAFFEDGTVHSEDSRISGSDGWIYIADYCEETDDYLLRSGWFEDTDYCEYEDGIVFLIDDFVLAWMPLPDPFMEVKE